MPSIKKSRLFAADFETVTYKGITETEVWAAGIAELYTENVYIYNSINGFFDYLYSLQCGCVVWFHNLRFDGSFILNRILRDGYMWNNGKLTEMPPRTFKALISDDQRYYSITIKKDSHSIIEFRDSVKLMPFKLKDIAYAFKTKHKKLEMEYTGKRKAGGYIAPDEERYLKNDVLVLKEALEFMLQAGNDKLTIGSCCVANFKEILRSSTSVHLDYKEIYPDLKTETLSKVSGAENQYEYIMRAYRGGWCYLLDKYADTFVEGGNTYDVNSLYPSVMHSDSGNYYPVGAGKIYYGGIPDICKQEGMCWYVRIRCRFYLKPGHVPTIQVKRDQHYSATEWLKTSDIKYRGKYYSRYKDINGEIVEAKPTLTLYMTDFELLMNHYAVKDLEILDCIYFYGMKGIFDEYINRYMKIKQESTGAMRTEAKLFLNTLYGKLATSDNGSYLIPKLEDGKLTYDLVTENEKPTMNIAQGAAVTAYARYFTITHAQQNYADFIYADTDSLHMRENKNGYKNIREHESALLCWKHEGTWARAKFIRQKTYAEFITHENGKRVTPYWEIKCAGMPDVCKRNFLDMHPITDFKYGLQVPGKLVPRQIVGGVVLEETSFTLKKPKTY